MDFISWKNITLTDGFWKYWQETAAKETSNAIYDRFYETGRIDAMSLDWTPDKPNKPHVFWDSDIAKWLEGTAYTLYNYPDAALKEKLDTIIEKIEKGQTEDGYFNSAILTLCPNRRFTDRTNHELYTAGHLIEAAVAYYEAFGDTRFLTIMERFADCIYKVFAEDQSAPYKTPGHQEIELALVRLYHASGNPKYLKLSKHFVSQRGKDVNERVFSVENGTFPAYPPLDNQMLYNDTYAQDNAPATELSTAGGHAVRAMYYYTAMAYLACEYHDDELFKACARLWNDCVSKKMYVTGGVSAERYGEAIGTDYVLPLELSYAETCASVAMSNWGKAMFALDKDSKYMDMIELQMYNGALAGLSIDGRAFYYDNALMCRPKVTDFFTGINARPLYPAYQRQEVFNCSCCPPNIYRFIAALGQYFYATDDTCIYINHYAASKATVHFNNQDIRLTQKTNYPWDGLVNITVNTCASGMFPIALRIPGWCPKADILVNGEACSYKVLGGYAYISHQWTDGDVITLNLSMPVTELYANPKVTEVSGKVALRRGPVVYCLEGADNPDCNIFDITLGKQTPEFTVYDKNICGHFVKALQADALISKTDEWENVLYTTKPPHYEKIKLTAIPYYCWSNRQVNDMTVWIKKQF